MLVRRALMLLALLCAACSAPAAEPPSPDADPSDGLRGRMDGPGEVWALPLGEYPPRAGQVLKIVWRVTGDGEAVFRARRPDGVWTGPAWGPERHQGSSFARPGEEWGTGFAFTVPGVWLLEVRRPGLRGELAVEAR